MWVVWSINGEAYELETPGTIVSVNDSYGNLHPEG